MFPRLTRFLFVLALPVALCSCASTPSAARRSHAPVASPEAPTSAVASADTKAPTSTPAPEPAPATAKESTAATDDFGDADYATSAVHAFDPLEPVNRFVFKFNDKTYHYVFHPVADTYVKVVPHPIRTGLSNFFTNLGYPIRVVNDLLQAKFKRAGLESGKFYVNTIAGLGGFIRISDDVPSLANIPAEDMGLTFGVWRIPQGPYLVVPLLGPTTLRDGTGLVGDYFLNPLNWSQFQYRSRDYWWWDVSFATVDVIQKLPDLMILYESQKKAALDPYIAVRSAYLQYRAAQVKK